MNINTLDIIFNFLLHKSSEDLINYGSDDETPNRVRSPCAEILLSHISS